jgi:hypothetical protein
VESPRKTLLGISSSGPVSGVYPSRRPCPSVKVAPTGSISKTIVHAADERRPEVESVVEISAS